MEELLQVLKLMHFVLKMKNFVFKTMNFALKTMYVALNMMDSVGRDGHSNSRVSHLLTYQAPACSTDLRNNHYAAHVCLYMPAIDRSLALIAGMLTRTSGASHKVVRGSDQRAAMCVLTFKMKILH